MRSLRRGPPSVAPHCAWRNGALGASIALPRTSSSRSAFGVQRVVAQEEEGAAVQLVGAALGHGVHDAARRAAELGRERGRHHLELPHRVLAEGRGDGAVRAMVVVEAVHHHVVRAARWPAKDRPEETLRPEGGVRSTTDPRRQQGEGDEVTAVGRAARRERARRRRRPGPCPARLLAASSRSTETDSVLATSRARSTTRAWPTVGARPVRDAGWKPRCSPGGDTSPGEGRPGRIDRGRPPSSSA